MAEKIILDYTYALPFIATDALQKIEPDVQRACEQLNDKTGAGAEWLGWRDWPDRYDKREHLRLQEAARRIISQSEVLLVLGIGGSYLGARAGLTLLTNSFYNELAKADRPTPRIYFIGNNLSADYLHDVFEMLSGSQVSVNVISKSGTTLETAVSFRLVKTYMEERYGSTEAARRIFITTSPAEGVLRQVAIAEGYEMFEIPTDIGGRFSVLTAVGLLPMAAAGIDIDEVLAGAQEARRQYQQAPFTDNTAQLYAALRNLLYRQGRHVELFAVYEPAMRHFAEWWKQLFGESEGKDGRGLFPAAVNFTTDLHSLGQYIQDGWRGLFETVVFAKNSRCQLTVDMAAADDGMEFLAGQTLQFINHQAMRATAKAHVTGGVPNICFSVPRLTAYFFGQMVYLFEEACGISGYLLGVNPFNQPGVEAYKRNMLALLGKPGLEDLRKQLQDELQL